MASKIDQLRQAAADACVRLGTATVEVQIVVARSYGAIETDDRLPPLYTVMVDGVGPKTLTFSANDLDDAIKMAMDRVSGTG